MKFFEIKVVGAPSIEVDTEAQMQEVVRNYIESGHEHISVVTWVKGSDGRDRSAALAVYENGRRREINIH